jgi:hypothetical protein
MSEYKTRLAFAYDHKVPYSTVSDRIRRGEITLHLIDGKVQINVEEALEACQPKTKRSPRKFAHDLFAA